MIRHAGLIARRTGGPWRGVLILGPSGVGKSDLALRALDLGFRLVADDRVSVFSARGRLFGRAPATLAGLIEVCGVGIASMAPLAFAEIVLVARCVGGEVERLGPDAHETILGVEVPAIDLRPLEPSAPSKLLCAIERLGAHSQEGYQAPFASPGRRVGA